MEYGEKSKPVSTNGTLKLLEANELQNLADESSSTVFKNRCEK